MLFNSFHFIIFFIFVTISYFLLPHKFRWILLLISSYIFYMAWRAELILLIVFSTAANFIISNKMYSSKSKRRRKNLLFLSLFINFGLLFVFKYLVFINNSFAQIFSFFDLSYPVREFDIILPMGISFYTFQAAAYTIDVYRGEVKPEKHFGIFSLFITFFPQLVAGPIERSKNLLPQFYKKHYFSLDRAVLGIKIMIWGFFKKVVIADRAAVAVNGVYNNIEYHSGLSLVIATIFFAFQIYCDFSGYSDIARGSAKVLGFELMENFKRPFIAKSVKEFWRRWHISLSTWFTDYVYIPLGGSKCSKLKHNRNLILTFLISGLWHGASWTFVIWGGLHGVFLVYENITYDLRQKIKHALGWKRNAFSTLIINLFSSITTLTLVITAFLFFRANTINDSIYAFKHLLWGFRQWGEPTYIYHTLTSLGIGLYELLILAASIVLLMILEVFGGKDLHKSLMETNSLFRIFLYGFLVYIIITAGVFYNAGEFIYFQF